MALEMYGPSAIVALGADCVTETTSALGLSARPAQPVSLVPLDESFGRVRERYERTIEMIAPENEAPAVFLRRAPFRNWHRPTGIGVHAIGSSESGVRGAIPPEHKARPDFVGEPLKRRGRGHGRVGHRVYAACWARAVRALPASQECLARRLPVTVLVTVIDFVGESAVGS